MNDNLDAVRTVLIESLELSQSPGELAPDTALFGALPELDSFGVVALVAAIEERFDITIDDDEFGAELFDTVGTLSDFVDAKLASAVR
ncbi:acyl carrier protein [Microbacterium pygmaeum]|uniref:Acyl carrier protein n=1 Tax=Microbacterium pygmaeum TaxID=370764 RepID=A0A1G8DUT1_9MICO|nr:acyl carrier protein [Microbacterium pygmaeum]SDH61169.1 acyl carrier protein [Microbacterium pygmaeum]